MPPVRKKKSLLLPALLQQRLIIDMPLFGSRLCDEVCNQLEMFSLQPFISQDSCIQTSLFSHHTLFNITQQLHSVNHQIMMAAGFPCDGLDSGNVITFANTYLCFNTYIIICNPEPPPPLHSITDSIDRIVNHDFTLTL